MLPEKSPGASLVHAVDLDWTGIGTGFGSIHAAVDLKCRVSGRLVI